MNQSINQSTALYPLSLYRGSALTIKRKNFILRLESITMAHRRQPALDSKQLEPSTLTLPTTTAGMNLKAKQNPNLKPKSSCLSPFLPSSVVSKWLQILSIAYGVNSSLILSTTQLEIRLCKVRWHAHMLCRNLSYSTQLSCEVVPFRYHNR